MTTDAHAAEVRGDLAEFRGPVPRPSSGSGGIGLRKRGPSRIKATKTRWENIRAEKLTACRVCGDVGDPAKGTWLQLHHLVFRSHGGDDVTDNLVPVHNTCHDLVHARDQGAVRALLASLTDAEYAYAIEKEGEGFFERGYGLIYERAA